MIKNIIFDFGGIFLDIFPEKAIIALQNLGIKNNIDKNTYFKEDNFFKKIEIENNVENLFVKETKRIMKADISVDLIYDAWNKLLGEYNKSSIEIAQKAKLKYRIFLLSNTNKIHYDNYILKFKEEFGYNLHEIFEKTYFSHQIGMRKPNKDIFEFVLSDAKIIPEETIFIDDSIENRITAEKLGIKTIALQTNQGLENIAEVKELIY